MSYLPPGFDMAFEIARHNAAMLDIIGELVAWTPVGGSATPVRVIRSDPNSLAAAGVLMTLFGTMAASGFTQMPAKKDAFTVDAVNYIVFDVQGPDEFAGIYLHLTK